MTVLYTLMEWISAISTCIVLVLAANACFFFVRVLVEDSLARRRVRRQFEAHQRIIDELVACIPRTELPDHLKPHGKPW